MELEKIENGESGLVVRNKINAVVDKVNENVTKLSKLPEDAYSKLEVDTKIGDINTILESI